MMLSLDAALFIQQCAPTVAPQTMQSIVKVESAFKPFVIGSTVRLGKNVYLLKRQPHDKSEAVVWANWLMQNGYRFDAGPAQVNSVNFARFGLSAESAFDPCLNIAVGGAILTQEYRRAAKQMGEGAGALNAAISSYNSGSFERGITNGYVRKVRQAGMSATAPIPSPIPMALQGQPL